MASGIGAEAESGQTPIRTQSGGPEPGTSPNLGTPASSKIKRLRAVQKLLWFTQKRSIQRESRLPRQRPGWAGVRLQFFADWILGWILQKT
jgi:hypothetical protein